MKKATASSFADSKDVANFEKYKSLGMTDQQAFNMGDADNAVGCWGDSTAAGSGPSCALHVSVIKRRWGSKKAGKHKKVRVVYGGKEVICVLKDICGKADRIDLNPDALKALGLKPPVLVTVHGEWV